MHRLSISLNAALCAHFPFEKIPRARSAALHTFESQFRQQRALVSRGIFPICSRNVRGSKSRCCFLQLIANPHGNPTFSILFFFVE